MTFLRKMKRITRMLEMSKTKETTLQKFLKDNCANYDKHYQSCLFADSCRVFDGQRCGYFERCVLGPPEYKYKLPGYDYAKLFAQYAEQTGAKAQKVKVRRCECGKSLRPQQRYCDDCTKKRRRKTRRIYQQKFRRNQKTIA